MAEECGIIKQLMCCIVLMIHVIKTIHIILTPPLACKASTQHKNPCPDGHDFSNLNDPSLIIIPSYSVLSVPGSREDFKSNNECLYSYCMPQHKNTCSWVMKIRIFLGNHFYISVLSFSQLCPVEEMKIFKVIYQFYPKSMSPWVWG